MATPKPWPEGTIPTSTQLTDWFLEQPHDEQVAIMSVLQADQRTAAACWQQDHGGILLTLEALEARVAELMERDLAQDIKLWRARAHRYRAAWLSARRGRRTLRGAWAELVRQATANRVSEIQLVTTYSDYLPEPDGRPKPSGYCVDSMVSGPADHARCEGRGHLGQPCGCTCHHEPPAGGKMPPAPNQEGTNPA